MEKKEKDANKMQKNPLKQNEQEKEENAAHQNKSQLCSADLTE